jgi:hypothetical protein
LPGKGALELGSARGMSSVCSDWTSWSSKLGCEGVSVAGDCSDWTPCSSARACARFSVASVSG